MVRAVEPFVERLHKALDDARMVARCTRHHNDPLLLQFKMTLSPLRPAEERSFVHDELGTGVHRAIIALARADFNVCRKPGRKSHRHA